ncbi:MAG: cyclic nucleotide-binding domain-containing protein [Desulfatiglandales bacterium]
MEILQKIESDPELSQYLKEYPEGRIVFYEGDESLDLFILVEGALEVKKGHKTVAFIREVGEIFGEMASILDRRRTATVKTTRPTKVLQLPYEHFDEIRKRHAWINETINQWLAKRVRRTTDILLAMEQICDKVPEALILTDEYGNILSSNVQAQYLFEYKSSDLSQRKVQELFGNDSAIEELIKKAKIEGTVTGEILSLPGPKGEKKYLSMSITCNKDPLGKVINLSFLTKDVTDQIKREKKLKAVALLATLLALVLLPVLGYVVYHYEKRSVESSGIVIGTSDLLKKLKDDAIYISKFAIISFESKDQSELIAKIRNLLKNDGEYRRILVLDEKGKVLIYQQEDEKQIKQSFKYPISQLKREGAPFKVLRLYETTPEFPSGRGITHIAYRLEKDNKILGWVVFEPKRLEIDPGISEFN